MQEKLIRPILNVSGVVTMLAGVQFFAPALVLRTSGVPVTEAAGLFYAQHWALLVLVVGALLLYAARHPEVRRPILLAVGAEKVGFVGLLLMQWSDPALLGLHLAAPFDAVCVVLYALIIAGRR